MTDQDAHATALATLSSDPAFERRDDGFEVTTVVVDAVVRVASPGDAKRPEEAAPRFEVTVRVPSIDAVVVGETVARVVREGWFETFRRRLDAPHQAGRSLDPLEPEVERIDDRTVEVRMGFADEDPQRAAENARALAAYVEGVWFEGLIPGYDYREPASTLLERAMDRHEDS